MLLWQKMMIGLARSEWMTKSVQSSRFLSLFARQFVGGNDALEALDCARDLKSCDISASLFYLGEYVDDPKKIKATLEQLREIAAALALYGLDVHISVDPTQVGSMISWSVCRENVLCLAHHVAENSWAGRDVLMLDMEDSSVTQHTLDLYRLLLEKRLPVAVTVQAYLHRTQCDLLALINDGAMVRLVKGAFAEPANVAVTDPRGRDEAFRKATATLFSPEARENGVYPVLGTHDHRMVDFARHIARENGWKNDEWEVEMLFGVRSSYQRALVRQGVSLRLYLPFGKDWFPYSIRRVGENPKNFGFVLRSIAGRKSEMN